jgi:hypothetical protein
MQDKLEFRQVREFGSIISDTFVFIKQNFKALIKSYFIICGIFVAASIISMALYKMQEREITTGYVGQGFWYTIDRMVFTWEYFLLIVVSMLNYVSIYITILSFVAIYIQKGNIAPSTEEIWGYYKYYFLRMFGSTLAMSIFLVICFAFCILPGVYVFPAFTIFFPIMILENGSFSHSFDRSFRLLKGEWWITAAVIFVIYIIFYMISLVVQLPAFFLQIISTLTHTEAGVRKGYTIASSIFTCLSQVFIIIPIIGSCLIYFNLTERKESLGLLERIDTLGQKPDTDTSHLEEY